MFMDENYLHVLIIILGTTLSFSQSTFYVNENDGPALPVLALSVPAPFDITVYISSFNKHLSCELYTVFIYSNIGGNKQI